MSGYTTTKYNGRTFVLTILLSACFALLMGVGGLTLTGFAAEHDSLRNGVNKAAATASVARQEAKTNKESIQGINGKIDDLAAKFDDLNITISKFMAAAEERRRHERTE